jgi:hypothetical protein
MPQRVLFVVRAGDECSRPGRPSSAVVCFLRAVWSYEPVMGPEFESLMGELPGPHVAAEDAEENPSQATLVNVLLADLR